MSDSEKAARLRAQVPCLSAGIYLNAGSVGPLPEPVQQAMEATAREEYSLGRVNSQARHDRIAYADRARAAVAELLGAYDDEVALTFSATDAMNVALWGLDWKPGDELLTSNLENSAALVPMYIVAERRGVELRIVDLGNGEADAAEAFERSITPRTRLILVSDVTYSTGASIDVRAIARVAHSHGIPVLVDGAQSAGSVPRFIHDLEVDYYALSGHKWLCGPQGTGALYVSRSAVVALGMSYGGVYSDAEHGAGGRLALFNAAKRHEVSTRNYPALAGQAASIRWMLDEVGIEWAYERAHSMAEHARKLLASIPEVDVITPSNHVGLIGFTVPGRAEAAADWLDARGVWCRSIRVPDLVRLSIGFYTTEEELARVAALIEERVHGGVRV